MQVASIMTSPVVGIAASASIKEAADLMITHRISGLPVVDDSGRLLGIVSEGDFLRRSELGTERKRSWWLEFLLSPGKAADEYVHAHGRKIEEIMTTQVVTVASETSVQQAVNLMTKRRVKRLPVLADGRVVGIVTRSDLLRAMLRVLRPADDSSLSASDADIKSAVMAEIKRQPWGGGRTIDAVVKDGEVELSGAIFDERERGAARVAAENVPGVKSVRDNLILVDQISGTTF